MDDATAAVTLSHTHTQIQVLNAMRVCVLQEFCFIVLFTYACAGLIKCARAVRASFAPNERK